MDAQYKLYCDFKGASIVAHPDLKADAAQKLAQAKWNGVKKNKYEVKNLIRTWKANSTERKSRRRLKRSVWLKEVWKLHSSSRCSERRAGIGQGTIDQSTPTV